RPDNGPASKRLAALVERDLLPEEPYRAYGITLDEFFSNPSPRLIVDLAAISNRVYGRKSDSRILRDVGIEAVRTHPRAYATGVTRTIGDLLWQSVYRSLPDEGSGGGSAAGPGGQVSSESGETIVVNGKRLPKP